MPKLKTISDYSKWHSPDEIPEVNCEIIIKCKNRFRHSLGVIIRESGWMHLGDNETGYWDEIAVARQIEYWTYLKNLEARND